MLYIGKLLVNYSIMLVLMKFFFMLQILVPVLVDSCWFVYSFHVSQRIVHLLDPDPQQAKSKDITVLKRLV